VIVDDVVIGYDLPNGRSTFMIAVSAAFATICWAASGTPTKKPAHNALNTTVPRASL